MAEANVFFLYDIDTQELLGFSVFEGTFKRVSFSEDKKNLVLEVENYRLLPFEGSIIPTIKDGAIHVGIYEILRNCNSTAVDVELVRFHCGPHPKQVIAMEIPKFAERARLEIKKHREEAERQANQLANQLVLMATMASSTSNKWKS